MIRMEEAVSYILMAPCGASVCIPKHQEIHPISKSENPSSGENMHEFILFTKEMQMHKR